MFREIRAAMLLKGMTADTLAERIGISKAALSTKMNGKRDFKLTEMIKIRDTLAPDETLDKLFVTNART